LSDIFNEVNYKKFSKNRLIRTGQLKIAYIKVIFDETSPLKVQQRHTCKIAFYLTHSKHDLGLYRIDKEPVATGSMADWYTGIASIVSCQQCMINFFVLRVEGPDQLICLGGEGLSVVFCPGVERSKKNAVHPAQDNFWNSPKEL